MRPPSVSVVWATLKNKPSLICGPLETGLHSDSNQTILLGQKKTTKDKFVRQMVIMK